MSSYTTVPQDATLETAKAALEANGFAVTVVESLAEAKTAALALIPEGSEVMTMTSRTLTDTGIAEALNESGKYNALRPKFMEMMSDPSKVSEMRKLGAAPDYVIGSVHGLTEDGHVLIASATGSQLPAYAYGAGHVVWVVGAQKITKNLEEAHKRLLEHTIPLEDARALEAYGMHTSLNKMLTFNKEQPGRIDIILVKEVVGF